MNTEEKNTDKLLLGAYQEANRNIRKEIEDLSLKGYFTQEEMHKVGRLRTLNKSIDKIINKLINDTNKTLTLTQLSLFKEGFEVTAKEINKYTDVKLSVLLIPEKQVRAVLDNKLDKIGYINRNKVNGNRLKARLRQEIMIGIIEGKDYVRIAKRIEEQAKIGLSNAVRIARTEGHRAREEGNITAMEKGKALGLKIKKKWLSASDKRVRDDHKSLNGQIREMKEPFEINGMTAMYPGMFGVAKEDVNCRCSCITVFEK